MTTFQIKTSEGLLTFHAASLTQTDTTITLLGSVGEIIACFQKWEFWYKEPSSRAVPELLEVVTNFIETVQKVDPGVYRDVIDDANEIVERVTGKKIE